MSLYSRKFVALVAALAAGVAVAQQVETTPTAEAAAPRAFTGIKGTLTDVNTGEPLMLAPVKVTRGAAVSVETDLEGNYVLPLPPGEYSLRFWYDGYEGKDVVGARVIADNTTRIDMTLKLVEAEFTAEEVVVTATIDERTAETVLMDRKTRSTVSDAISAQELSRTPDSSAADAVKRVVGATVVGKSVALRGLSGRYATTLVNGVALPSPDPDGHQAPLDIMPTGLLANMTVMKSYGAELPGTFAGGALSMDTTSFPSEPERRVKLSFGGNSVATLQQRNGLDGGGAEFFGFDSGMRTMPNSIPRNSPLQTADARAAALEFDDTWEVARVSSMPNLGLGVSVGDTVELGTNRLGYLANFGFSHAETAKRARVKAFSVVGEGHNITRDYAQHSGTTSGALNAMLNLGYSLGANTDVGVLSLFTRSGESEASLGAGDYSDDPNPQVVRQLVFEERTLWFNQLRGFHRLSETTRSSVKWQANFSTTHRNEPDTRNLVYEERGIDNEWFKPGPGSGERFFSGLTDRSFGGSGEYRRTLEWATLSAGLSAQVSDRSLSSRRFRYETDPSLSGYDRSRLSLRPEELFTDQNIASTFRLREFTRTDDAYEANRGVFGVFAAADVIALAPLRLNIGLRAEAARDYLVAKSPHATVAVADSNTVDRTQVDLLPTLNVIYPLTANQNLRAGYSYTVVRPQFREMAPFKYTDYLRRRNISGNPDILPVRIHNADVRWEHFTDSGGVLAASGFYKSFVNPIEQRIGDVTNGDLQYMNTPGAFSYGAELEARSGLGVLSSALADLNAGANLTLIQSEVDLGHTSANSATNGQRPLQGQSPYVVNVSLGYSKEALGLDVALLYNVFGPRITEVGINPKPDVYEQPFHRLDATVARSFKNGARFKFAVTNLLNQQVVEKQGDVEVLTYHPGVAGSMAVEWSF